MIVIKESRSLFLSEHLNSRAAGGYCCSFYKSNSNLPKCPWCQIKAVSRLKCCRHDFQKKRALQPFPASILHPRVTPHVFHSWSLSRRLIHSKEQKWHGESGVIFFPLKNRKEKHLWARAQLLRRAKALCTFPSTLTVSLPVCGLDVGIRRGTFVDVRLTIVDVMWVLFGFVFWDRKSVV